MLGNSPKIKYPTSPSPPPSQEGGTPLLEKEGLGVGCAV